MGSPKPITITFNNSAQVNTVKQLLEFLQGKNFKTEPLVKNNSNSTDVVCSSKTIENKNFITVDIKNGDELLYSATIRCGTENFVSFLIEIQSLQGEESVFLEIYWKYLAIMGELERKEDTGLIKDFKNEWILKLQSDEDTQVLSEETKNHWNPDEIFMSIYSNQFQIYWGQNERFFINKLMQQITPEAASNLRTATVKERIDILYRELFPNAINISEPIVLEKENNLPVFSIDQLFDIGQFNLVHERTILINLHTLYKNFKLDLMGLELDDNVSEISALIDFYIMMLDEVDELSSKIHFNPALQDLEYQSHEKKSVLSLFSYYIQTPNLPFITQEHSERFLSIKKEHLNVFVSLFNKGSNSLINAFFGSSVSNWIAELKSFHEKQELNFSENYFYEQGILLLTSEKEGDCVLACLYQMETNLVWSFFKKFSTLAQSFSPQIFNQVILPALLAIDAFSEVTWEFQTALLNYLRSPVNSDDEILYLANLIHHSLLIEGGDKENFSERVIDLNSISKRPVSLLNMDLPDPVPNPEATRSLNQNLEALGYERIGVTLEENDCLIDTIIQLVNEELKINGCSPISSDKVQLWAKDIKEKMGKNRGDQLVITNSDKDIKEKLGTNYEKNVETTNSEIRTIVYLFQCRLAKLGIFVNFTLESYWANKNGDVDLSFKADSDFFSKVFTDKNMPGYVISLEVCLRILCINFNHYEPLIKKNIFNPIKTKSDMTDEYLTQKRSKSTIGFWEPGQVVLPFSALKIKIQLDEEDDLYLEIPRPRSFEELTITLDDELQKKLLDEQKTELSGKKLTLKGKEISSAVGFDQIMSDLSEGLLYFTISENKEEDTSKKLGFPHL